MTRQLGHRMLYSAIVLAWIFAPCSAHAAGWGRTPSGLCQFFGHGYGRGYHAPIIHRGAQSHAAYAAPYIYAGMYSPNGAPMIYAAPTFTAPLDEAGPSGELPVAPDPGAVKSTLPTPPDAFRSRMLFDGP